MGQEQSHKLRRRTPTRLVVLAEKMTNHAQTLKEIASLTYVEFVESVQTLNEMIEPFSEQSNKQLIFAVMPGGEDTFMWRAVIRIKCLKVDRRDGTLESSRTLNIHQFIRIHHEIMNQIDVARTTEFQTTNLMDASVLIDRITEAVGESVDEKVQASEECVICMDRRAQIMLDCTHNYCEKCIDEWNASSQSCPLCRQKIDTSDEAWVFAEKPNSSQLHGDVEDYLLGITGPSSSRQSERDDT